MGIKVHNTFTQSKGKWLLPALLGKEKTLKTFKSTTLALWSVFLLQSSEQTIKVQKYSIPNPSMPNHSMSNHSMLNEKVE